MPTRLAGTGVVVVVDPQAPRRTAQLAPGLPVAVDDQPMRRLAWPVVVGLCACSTPGPKQGAVLTFGTPDGMSATRIEIVLANAATDAAADLRNQRREPGSGETDDVRYLRQRALGGALEDMKSLDGFEMRIEPDEATSTDEQFIPIVLVYDHDALVGIGAVEDAAGDPSAVQIAPNVLTTYAVTVTPLQSVGEDAALDPGTARIVSCFDRLQQPWQSGIAWVAHTRQLRLLLPDISEDPMATDATARGLDLDCDAHDAEDADCDDLRGSFYNGAPESCDGLDTNCDSVRYVPEACTQSALACNIGAGTASGVRVCDDEEGTQGACTPSAACLCGTGASNGCTRCIVDFTGPTSARTACSPSVGQIHLAVCEGTACTVEVAGATPPWRAFIGTADTGPFTTKLQNVHTVFLEAKRSGALPFAAGNIGEAYLLVTPNGSATTVTLPIQFEMSSDSQQCTPLSNPSVGSKMTCSP